MEKDERIREAVERTEILRSPKQSLYAFGTTVFTIIWLPSQLTLSW